MVSYLIAMCILVCNINLQANQEIKLTFLDSNLDDFISRVVHESEDRNQFKIYFSQLTKKIDEAKQHEPLKERATYRYLYNVALQNLKEQHIDWYELITPYVCNPLFTLDENFDELRNGIKQFLTRYGAYQEFLNYRHTKIQQTTLASTETENGMWHIIKGYAHTIKHKVAGLFTSGHTA